MFHCCLHQNTPSTLFKTKTILLNGEMSNIDCYCQGFVKWPSKLTCIRKEFLLITITTIITIGSIEIFRSSPALRPPSPVWSTHTWPTSVRFLSTKDIYGNCQKNIFQTEYRWAVEIQQTSVSVSKIILPELRSINQDLSGKKFYLIATVTTNCSSQLSGSLWNHRKVWGYPGGHVSVIGEEG